MKRTQLAISTAILLVACLVYTPLLAQSADQAVMNVVQGMEQNRPQVLWEALPGSYQNDLTELVQGFGTEMEGSLWDQTFSTIGKLTQVLDEKRDFILEHPMVADKMSAASDSDAAYEGLVQVLATLVQSDLGSIAGLQHLDIENFLSTTGASLLAQMDAISTLSPESADDINDLRSTKATLVSADGNTAVVLVESPGEQPEEVRFVRVEGKWIPEELAESWDREIEEARMNVTGSAGAALKDNSAQAGAMLGMANEALDRLMAANSQEEFNATVQSVMGMVMLGWAAANSDSGN